jgi:hypothetical protein
MGIPFCFYQNNKGILYLPDALNFFKQLAIRHMGHIATI